MSLDAVATDGGLIEEGCGFCTFGRLAELKTGGFRDIIGSDIASAMIAGGRRRHPGIDLRHRSGGAWGISDPCIQKGERRMHIGFIGMGKMGTGMAANLIRAGHTLTVYNRTAAKTDGLVAAGAAAADSVATACRGAVVVTMLADDGAMAAVIDGDTGIIRNLGPGSVHLCMATISVGLSRQLTERHAAAGQHFVAAPVFGRPDAAAAGDLFIVAAGSTAAVDRCRPLFDAMGQRTFVVGDAPRMANVVKLSGNFLIAAVIESLGEAMTLVGKAGIDRHQYLDILTSTLFGAPVYKTYGALIADERFKPAGFAAPLGCKDIRLALAAGDEFQVPMPLASLLRDRFLALLAQGGDDLDWSAIARLAAEDAGNRNHSG
jgi:3-hydroxyisobutyrate dehydrogenase-like beta-hydroxyacid dehydrogenase